MSLSSPTLSVPLGVQSTAPLSRSSAKRWRLNEAAIFSSSASHGTSSDSVANLVIKHITTLVAELQQNQSSPPMTPDMVAASKATKLLSKSPQLSDQEKVELHWYFCRNTVEAASLPKKNDSYLAAIFQNILL